jgi:hypothetical protein
MIKQHDPRRWKERADGSMVYEDHTAPANLPREVINPEITHNDGPIDNSRMITNPVYMDFFNTMKGKE